MVSNKAPSVYYLIFYSRLCPEKMGRLLDHLCIYTEQVPSEGQPPDFGLRLRALRNASLDGNLPISDVEELLFRCLG